ncbi:MAG: Rne/Rng family ribonuclease [Planctomycetes bacterium]|nr:Rne/Rng family ribonuclease [Planctomycetota bacterium]
MTTHILMNVLDERELRVAKVQDGHLETVFHERIGDGQQLGNVYKARVANVEPSLDAAFLDLGTGKNGFLHVDEVMHGKGQGARIEHVLKPGDELMVQITKESIKDKGPCLTAYLSLPGRYLVLMASEDKRAVSRRIVDPAERKRLKKLLDEFEAPEGFGFIMRTAGEGRLQEEVRLDYSYLKRLWSEIETRQKKLKAPCVLYQEANVVVRTLRDVADADVSSVVVDDEDLYDETRAFAHVLMPELANAIQYHRDELPLFAAYGVEDRLATMLDRQVEMPSGGNVVIEQTEALVSIDVNSAKNREASNVADTALLTNLEAVQCISEQLILRDLGGLVIIDFIDMESRDHQRLVQLSLRKALLGDKAKTQVAMISRFGLVEMTRQRTRPSHKMVSLSECDHCAGTGVIKTAETVEIDCLRSLRRVLAEKPVERIEVLLAPDLAITVLNNRRSEINALEQRYECIIQFTGDTNVKDRSVRVQTVVRKGRRRKQQTDQAIRPSMIAPMLDEQVRIAQEARALMKKNPDELEREIWAITEGIPQKEAQAQAAQVSKVQEVVPQVPSLWEDAQQLRELLFNPSRPVPIGSNTVLASATKTARTPSPRHKSRRRRRSVRR